jgi:hypothetical protein
MKTAKMKFSNGSVSYLIEGLKTLHQVALISGHFHQPEPWQFPDFNKWTPSLTASGAEIFDWIAKKTKQHQKKLRRTRARNTKINTHLDTYIELITPLYKALKIPYDKTSIVLENFDMQVIPAFLRWQEKFTATFSDVATHGKESYQSLIRRFNDLLPAAKRNPINPENVPTVIRRGLALYRESASTRTNFNKLIWGIALIGCGSLALRDTRKCNFCPRRTLPRKKFCAEHSQADTSVFGRTRSRQAANYRTGKTACAIAKKLGLVDGAEAQAYGYQIGITENQITESGVSARQISQVAEIMLPAYLTWNGHAHWSLRDALMKSTRIQKLLNEPRLVKFTYIDMVDTIREKLNLFESDEGTLPYSLLGFEKWLECEAQAQPGVRGNGNLATMRMDTALDLARQGKKRKEIAIALGVRQSTVTLWIKKDTRLAAAFQAAKAGKI